MRIRICDDQPRTIEWPDCGQLIEDRFLSQEEGPLLDKKREHYYFYSRSATINPAKKKADFITDILALVNAASKRRTPAYIFFGIGEYDDWTPYNIAGQHPNPPRNLSSWDYVKAHPAQFNRWIETIYGEYVSLLERFVEPVCPDVDYQTGWVVHQTDTLNETLMLAVLEIHPLNRNTPAIYLRDDPQQPGALQELADKSGYQKLKPGFTKRRIGSISRWVSPEERSHLFPEAQDIPFIPKKGWLNYLDELMQKFAYLNPADAQEAAKYQKLDAINEAGSSLRALEHLREFARHTIGPKHILVVTGMPGVGKTTILRQLAYELAVAAKEGIEKTKYLPYVVGQLRWLDQPNPDDVVPIYVPLSRWAVSNLEECGQRFGQAITDFAGEAAQMHDQPQPLNLLKDQELNLLVMLDGLDEVDRWDKGRWDQTIGTLREVIGRFPQAKFIVTCRSDQYAGLGPNWRLFPHIELKPLSIQQVEDLIGQEDWQVDIEPEIFERLKREVLVNPRALDALKRPASGFTRLTLGAAISHVMGGRLSEEYHKEQRLDPRRFAHDVESKLASLAFEMLIQGVRGWPEARVRQQIGDEVFDWAWRAGLLAEVWWQIRFDSDFALGYWAGQYLNVYDESDELLARLMEAVRNQPSLWEVCIRITLGSEGSEWSIERLEKLLMELTGVSSGMALRVMHDLRRWDELEAAAELVIETHFLEHDDSLLWSAVMNELPVRLQKHAIDMIARPSDELFETLRQIANDIGRPIDIRWAAIHALKRTGYSEADEFEARLLEEIAPRLEIAREEIIVEEDTATLSSDELPIPKLD